MPRVYCERVDGSGSLKAQKTKSWRRERGEVKSEMMNSAGGLIKGQ